MTSYIDLLPIEIIEHIHYINHVYYANIIIKRWKKYNQILSHAYNLLDYLIRKSMKKQINIFKIIINIFKLT